MTEDACLEWLRRHSSHSPHHLKDFRDDEDLEEQVENARCFVVEQDEKVEKELKKKEKEKVEKELKKNADTGGGKLCKLCKLTQAVTETQEQLRKPTQVVSKQAMGGMKTSLTFFKKVCQPLETRFKPRSFRR